MKQILEEIESYWTNRAEGYSKVNQDELASEQKERWRKVILERLPQKPLSELQVLDIGTGPGFFAILLAEMGIRVTAVDYTEEMMRQARSNAKDLADKICWKRMDAQELTLDNDSFDAIVTRNVTWNLQNPEKAYYEWYRVLKPGGVLLNFDANWYNYLYEPKLKEQYEADRINVKKAEVEDFYEGTDIDAMEKIAAAVPLSKIKRPSWDREILKKAGFRKVETEEQIGERVLSEAEKINYKSTPIFLISAEK